MCGVVECVFHDEPCVFVFCSMCLPIYLAVSVSVYLSIFSQVSGTIFEDLLNRYPLSSSSSDKPTGDGKSLLTAPPPPPPPSSCFLTVPCPPSPLPGEEVHSSTASTSSSTLLLPTPPSVSSSSSPPRGREEERENSQDRQREEDKAKGATGKDFSPKREEREKFAQEEEKPAVCNGEEASQVEEAKKNDRSSSKPSESLSLTGEGGKARSHPEKEQEKSSLDRNDSNEEEEEKKKKSETVVLSAPRSSHHHGEVEGQEKTGTRRGTPFRYRLDFAQIYRLFYVDEESLRKASKTGKALEEGTGAGGSNGGGKKKLGVLDSKSSQNVEICLKKYKLSSLEDFKSLTQEIDDPTTLSIDTNLADNITQYWPDSSMKEALGKKTMEEVGAMPSADQLYFVLLTQISLAKEKLNFFIQ